MGQHLQLYASDKISLEQAKEWCRYRAHDLIEMPTPGAHDVMNAMSIGSAARVDNIEHGSKAAVVRLGFLVCNANIIDDALLYRIAKASVDGLMNSEHVIEFLRQRMGWVVWGDNDGV